MQPAGIVCAQIGAREHYAIPRALHHEGHLDTLYTDAWAGLLLRLFGFGPLRAVSRRYQPDIPIGRIVSFTAQAIFEGFRRSFGAPRNIEDQYRDYLRIGQRFGSRVAKHLRLSGARPRAFFGYNTGCLEPIEYLRGQGVPTIVDQIDPARTEEEIVLREADKWPGWSKYPGRVPEEYYARLSAEWSAATAVMVNSEWSRTALISQGVPSEKLHVIPLAYEAPALSPAGSERVADGCTVLWLGQVNLRKGIPYLIEAAKMLIGRSIRFVVAGSMEISEKAVRSAPDNMSFVGPVSRDRTTALYRSADLFVLPTMSDGFALTQLEAMAHGLPVVTTPNCGKVVTDGFDGRIVPAGDAQALAAALEDLATHPDKRHEMSRNAVETSRGYSLDHLSDKLMTLFDFVANSDTE